MYFYALMVYFEVILNFFLFVLFIIIIVFWWSFYVTSLFRALASCAISCVVTVDIGLILVLMLNRILFNKINEWLFYKNDVLIANEWSLNLPCRGETYCLKKNMNILGFCFCCFCSIVEFFRFLHVHISFNLFSIINSDSFYSRCNLKLF
jgi:hypothetical protein